MSYDHSRIARSEHDTRELSKFSRYLIEMGAHMTLERTVGRKLPVHLATLPESYWNPQSYAEEPRV